VDVDVLSVAPNDHPDEDQKSDSGEDPMSGGDVFHAACLLNEQVQSNDRCAKKDRADQALFAL
jgi:hypothetical protein